MPPRLASPKGVTSTEGTEQVSVERKLPLLGAVYCKLVEPSEWGICGASNLWASKWAGMQGGRSSGQSRATGVVELDLRPGLIGPEGSGKEGMRGKGREGGPI